MSITRYCDEKKLSIEQRLRLFEQVCEGIHHAHQKGIIHRDIKPSNILISVHGDKAVPKIIDFGIAKAITQPLTDKTFVTFQGQLLGTPEYMSPEQVDLATQDIDTRSDIYSLGVVLYELLAGVLPFEDESFGRRGFAEIQRTIRELEPVSPSMRLTSLGEKAKTIAASRGTQVVPLVRRLHRELEWIPLKAMRKDRCRRYRSASEMDDDIHNYLTGRPLIAGPETAIYRVQKFVHKHAGSVATVALVAAAIVVGLVVGTAMYFRAEDARQKEAAARAQAEQAAKKEAVARQQETVARVQAQEAQKVAQEQRTLAEVRAEELRRTLYVNSIQLADADYRESNIGQLREALYSCPDDLRSWEWHRLNYISDQSIMTLRGHEGGTCCTTWTPDGRRIVSGGYDNTVKVWDVDTGKELMMLKGHTARVFSITVSPDGEWITSGSYDKIVRIWNASTGSEVITLSGHSDRVVSVAFSPDGRGIVSGSLDNTIRVWDIREGNSRLTIKNANGDAVFAAVFSSDGRRIVSGGRDGHIRVWDAESGSQLLAIPHAQGTVVMSVAFSPDGRRIG